MALKATFRVAPYGFRPVSHHAQETHGMIPLGRDVEISIDLKPSDPQRKFFFAMLRGLSKATGRGEAELRERLLIATGFVRNARWENGDLKFEAMSMAEMGEHEFAAFVEAAVEKVCQYLGQNEGRRFVDEIWSMIASNGG